MDWDECGSALCRLEATLHVHGHEAEGVLLPGLTGFELAKSLKARSSSLEVIYITAHQADLSAGDVRSPILMKPFAPASLLRAVRSHLPQALEASDSERQRTHQPSRSADEAGPA